MNSPWHVFVATHCAAIIVVAVSVKELRYLYASNTLETSINPYLDIKVIKKKNKADLDGLIGPFSTVILLFLCMMITSSATTQSGNQ